MAMTGEITLRGRVLPIGGLKEKLLAAKGAGMKTVIVPERNRRDVEELSREITGGLELVYAQNMNDVSRMHLCSEERPCKRRGLEQCRSGKEKIYDHQAGKSWRPYAASPASFRKMNGRKWHLRGNPTWENPP